MPYRLKRSTRTLTDGTKVVRTKLAEAPVLEWRLQAAQVRRLRAMPEFGRRFALAGDMNAGRRGPQAIVQAKATGLTPGEPDLRLYIEGGRLLLIENKNAEGRLSTAQRDRHALLRDLGYEVVVVKAGTEEEAADAAERLVRERLVANDNDEPKEKGHDLPQGSTRHQKRGIRDMA